jgi:7-keto-8-aminopelargonate synthetase-like enzyme
VANLAVAEALAGQFDTAYIDEKAHPSLQTAVRRIGCKVIEFPHLNPGRPRSSGAIIVTEGMFGANGSVAPVKDYVNTGARVWIDDAHGAGTREPESLPPHVIQTVTFSKAFGVYGGAILCSPALAKKLTSTRIFSGQTPLPLPLVNACLEAMDLLKPRSPLRKRLQENVNYMGASTPVIQITHASPSFKRKLLENKIFPTWIRYPGGPSKGYFRFAISSEHTKAQLDNLRDILSHAPVDTPNAGI